MLCFIGGVKAPFDFKNLKMSDSKTETIKASVQVIPFLIKTLVFLGIGYYAYNKLTNSFEKLKENNTLIPSNISNSQAKIKADAIYAAMKGFGNGFSIVKTNLAGLNYNAYVKVYNAFGERKGADDIFNKMTLTEWINDQFNESELIQLRFLLPGVF